MFLPLNDSLNFYQLYFRNVDKRNCLFRLGQKKPKGVIESRRIIRQEFMEMEKIRTGEKK